MALSGSLGGPIARKRALSALKRKLPEAISFSQEAPPEEVKEEKPKKEKKKRPSAQEKSKKSLRWRNGHSRSKR
jgi:hypothetical protein